MIHFTTWKPSINSSNLGGVASKTTRRSMRAGPSLLFRIGQTMIGAGVIVRDGVKNIWRGSLNLVVDVVKQLHSG